MRYPTRVFDLQSNRQVEHGQAFYHPELDILRFFAFFAVFFHHALPRQASIYIDAGLPANVTQWLLAAKEAGAFGVDLFFALSAFLITELLRREYVNRGTFGLRAFYVRRALRIWPLYFTFLAATIFVIPMILPGDQFGFNYVHLFCAFLWQLGVCNQWLAVFSCEPVVEHLRRRAVLSRLATVASILRNEPDQTACH